LVVLSGKGKTLRTALRKKADIAPSPAGINVSDVSSRALEIVLASLEDSKAENIVSIDIQGKSSLGDYRVVASGRSHRHVAAVAENLLKVLKEAGMRARAEGLGTADWVLIDAGDIIVHVFRPEIRDFYGIEKMWQAPDLEDETVH
jgi:ribosome-associated protein